MASLPHEQKVYDLRELAIDNCERCNKNSAKTRTLFGCGQNPRTTTPFHDCPYTLDLTCSECHCEFEIPTIGFLYMTKCPDCYKENRKKKWYPNNE